MANNFWAISSQEHVTSDEITMMSAIYGNITISLFFIMLAQCPQVDMSLQSDKLHLYTDLEPISHFRSLQNALLFCR